MPGSKGREFKVDGRQYLVAVRSSGPNADELVKVGITIKAGYGTNSVCIIRGMLNWWWRDTGTTPGFQVTPRVICDVIRYAHEQGWNPSDDKRDVAYEFTASEFIDQFIKAKGGAAT